jgi:hypothetical protein
MRRGVAQGVSLRRDDDATGENWFWTRQQIVIVVKTRVHFDVAAQLRMGCAVRRPWNYEASYCAAAASSAAFTFSRSDSGASTSTSGPNLRISRSSSRSSL